MWAAPLPASATALQLTLDTSSLSGTVAQLAFDFLNYDPASNNVTISDFSTDGTLGTVSTIGGVTGTLIPGPVTLTDTDLFNEFLQEITLGNSVSFTLNLTQQAPSGLLPDSFSFFLLNSTATLPLFATTDDLDPDFSAGTLFQVDIDGSSNGVVYNFAPAGTGSAVTWTLEPVSVPLPSTALLIGAGLLGGLAARWRMRLTPLAPGGRGVGGEGSQGA